MQQVKYGLRRSPHPNALLATSLLPLLCHPALPGAAVNCLQASARQLPDGGLALRFQLRGKPDDLRIPPPQQPAAVDGLWQTTCCEAFIAAVDAPDYREFNFSPSGQWAAYRFDAYRERDTHFVPASAPRIAFALLPDGFQLDVELAAALLPAPGPLNLSFTAVIEAADGSKSYWALAHAAEQPDFHHRQSFTLTLNTAQP